MYGPQVVPEPMSVLSPPVTDASDVEGVSLIHEAISTSAVVPLSGMREEVSHCVSSDVSLSTDAWWYLARECDWLTHMLVISSSVGMLNGIQRTTSDLRSATWFHFVLQTRSDRLVRSCPSGTVVLFKIKLVLAEPAGTCSVAAVPASRIPTRWCGNRRLLLVVTLKR